MIIDRPVRFGDFIVLYRAGTGGMGEVYRALKIGPGGFEKEVALKLINADISSDSEFRKMFMREAKIAAKLQHPNVISVYELGMAGGTLYISMEYVNGIPLNRLLNTLRERGEKLSEEEVAYILYSVSLALSCAHNFEDTTGEVEKVIHRDVTPHNIFISYGGDVKLGDFGVAKVIGYAYTEMTQKGVVKGKLSYMSPEQMKGEEIDERSDFFSLGIVGLELLRGRKVVSSVDISKAGSIKRDINFKADEFSEAFREFILKTLCEERDKRFGSAEEICDLFLRNFEIQRGRQTLKSRINSLFSDLIKEEEEKLKHLRLSWDYKNIKNEILERLGGEKTLVTGRKKRKTSPVLYIGVISLGIMVSAFVVVFAFLLKGEREKAVDWVMKKEERVVKEESEISKKKPSFQKLVKKREGKVVKSEFGLSQRKDFSKIKGRDFKKKEEMTQETRKSESSLGEMSKSRESVALITIDSEVWGYIFINGKKTKMKTPVRELKLKPGTYVIAVVNPVKGIVGMERVKIKKGERKEIIFKNKKEVEQ